MYKPKNLRNEVKGKLYSYNLDLLIEVVKKIRDLYPLNATIGRIMNSDQGGYHVLFTIMEEQ